MTNDPTKFKVPPYQKLGEAKIPPHSPKVIKAGQPGDGKSEKWVPSNEEPNPVFGNKVRNSDNA